MVEKKVMKKTIRFYRTRSISISIEFGLCCM